MYFYKQLYQSYFIKNFDRILTEINFFLVHWNRSFFINSKNGLKKALFI